MPKPKAERKVIERYSVTVKRNGRTYRTQVAPELWQPALEDDPSPAEIEGKYHGERVVETSIGSSEWLLIESEARYWLVPKSDAIIQYLDALKPSPGQYVWLRYDGKTRTKSGQAFKQIVMGVADGEAATE